MMCVPAVSQVEVQENRTEPGRCNAVIVDLAERRKTERKAVERYAEAG